MLEKMQVSILNVRVGWGGASPGWECCRTLRTQHQEKPTGKTRVLGGRAEKRALTVLMAWAS